MKNNAPRNTVIAIDENEIEIGLPNPSTENPRSRRSVFLKWLRKMHGWIGLWGATLGLLFGVTGILQNHRTIMKIPAVQVQETTLQVPLPDPVPVDVKKMADWLQQELALDNAATRTRSEPSRPVAWGDKALKQPERWSVTFNSPRTNLQAEYWVGNSFVTVKRNDNNVFGTLSNLHKGTGVGLGWILLADTLAGSIILLSLTGVLLWSQLNRRRLIGTGIGLTSLTLMIFLAVRAM
jgi:hypothetical protein